MPANLVHNEEDEKHWQSAKAAVREQYPDLDEEDDRFWRLTTSIFARMKSGHAKKSFTAVMRRR